jgi:glycosyltransferase involved in cell wall biosynthesis
MKVSIILPVYNTHEYLDKCISSVLNQTHRDIELICIDDGSTDGSGEIVDKYAAQDKRIVVVHQKNAGESAARNVGLRLATGDVWGFIDCDDWIDADMYETLLKAMTDNDADISVGSWYEETAAGTNLVKNSEAVVDGVFDNKQLYYYIYKRDCYRPFGYMWDKLYKKECFYDDSGNLFRFDENMRIGGDIIYLAQLVSNAKRVIYTDRCFYHYRQRFTSGSFSRNIEDRLGSVIAYQRVLELMKKCGVDNEAPEYAKRFLGYHCVLIGMTAIEQKHVKGLAECQKYMRLYEDSYRKTNEKHPERINLYLAIMNYII